MEGSHRAQNDTTIIIYQGKKWGCRFSSHLSKKQQNHLIIQCLNINLFCSSFVCPRKGHPAEN